MTITARVLDGFSYIIGLAVLVVLGLIVFPVFAAAKVWMWRRGRTRLDGSHPVLREVKRPVRTLH